MRIPGELIFSDEESERIYRGESYINGGVARNDLGQITEIADFEALNTRKPKLSGAVIAGAVGIGALSGYGIYRVHNNSIRKRTIDKYGRIMCENIRILAKHYKNRIINKRQLVVMVREELEDFTERVGEENLRKAKSSNYKYIVDILRLFIDIIAEEPIESANVFEYVDRKVLNDSVFECIDFLKYKEELLMNVM